MKYVGEKIKSITTLVNNNNNIQDELKIKMSIYDNASAWHYVIANVLSAIGFFKAQ